MKIDIIIYSLVLSVCIAHTGIAQESDNQKIEQEQSQEKFTILDQLQNNSLQVARENVSGINTVFIQQIGTGNQVFSNITAQSSKISLNQNGERNIIDITENSRTIKKLITQNGTNNTITEFSLTPEISTNLEILQEGDNHYFERFGNNNLSNTLKFKMTGTARTIIVRSF